MRRSAVFALYLPMLMGLLGRPVAAQDAPRRIGPVVVDVRGSFPAFPNDPALAESRGLDVRELPGRGLGADAGIHVYVARWKAVTLGIGGQVTIVQAGFAAVPAAELRAVTERLTSMAPHLSLNFGTGDGWSYLSVARGTSAWSIVPDGSPSTPADRERLRTFSYGGGARWFSKRHVGFTFDVRFHEVAPGSLQPDRPGSPRTTFVVLSAGMSIK
jgi:hypothetical protein